MSITVYSISGAPLPWRVLLGLEFKSLHYELKILKFSEKENNSEEYLKLNPRGTVPLLIDGPVIIQDSTATLAWLDRAYPDVPLYGNTPQEAAQIWQASTDIGQYLRETTHNLLSTVFSGNVQTSTPELLLSAKNLRAELDQLERMLYDKPFLISDRPSAADVVAFPDVRLLQRAIDTKSEIMSDLGIATLTEQFPLLTSWKNRVESYPGVLKTLPPHWEEEA